MSKMIAGTLLVLGMSGPILADEVNDAVSRITDQLKRVDARIQVKTIEPSALPDLYEVLLNDGRVVYADQSGKYLLQGPLYQVEADKGLVNLSETRLNAHRLELFEAIEENDMIAFKPEGDIKARVAVFTDVDCPYCRKLHKEVAKLNAMGIEVDYLAFPRGGERSAAFAKMQSLWCAEPNLRQAGMTQLKNGKSVEPLTCDSPVLEQYALGLKLGVSGTPALLFDDGRLVPGYMPAERLASMLGIKPE